MEKINTDTENSPETVTPKESDAATCSPWNELVETVGHMPPLEVAIWLYDGNKMWIGCRSDTPDGWFWCNAYGSEFFDHEMNIWLCHDSEADDDYKPTHWMNLPNPPESDSL